MFRGWFPCDDLFQPGVAKLLQVHRAVGVKVAAYSVPNPIKLLSVPPLTVTSPAAKLVVLSLVIKVRVIELSAEVSPSLT